MNRTFRISLFLLAALLLVGAFAIPAFAEGGGDVSGALQGAADAMTGGLQDKGNELKEAAAPLLSIRNAEDANNFLASYPMQILIIITAVALVVALFGYRCMKLSIFVGGALAGWMIGDQVIALLVSAGILSTETMPEYVPYIVCLICGLLIAVIALKVFKLGIFLLAAGGTYMFLNGFDWFTDTAGQMLSSIDFDEGAKLVLARVVVSVVVGIIALIVTRFVIIAVTAGGGGMVASFAFMNIIGQANPQTEVIVGLVLTAVGLFVQLYHHKKH